LAAEDGLAVVATTNPSQALVAAQALRPDVAVIDVVDGGAIAFDLTRSLREAVPEMQVVVVGEEDNRRGVCASVSGGASAYVTYEQGADSLVEAIRGVMCGETHIPPLLLTAVIRRLQDRRPERGQQQRALDGLTSRERTVLELMVAGMDRDAIGRKLGLRLNTVRTHAQNCYAKLGVHSSLEAVHVAHRAGIRPTFLTAVSSGYPRASTSMG
jgi:DNA-binding NarL/FixJ family response regulator